MKKKYFYAFPLLMIELMLQLVFFWLAPDIASKWAVYAICTTMTIVHLVLVFILMLYADIRRTAATIVSGTFVQMILIAASVIMLIADAEVRSTVFLLMIISILYVAVVMVFILTIEREELCPTRISGNGPSAQPEENTESRGSRNNRTESKMAERCTKQPVQSSAGAFKRTAPPPLPARR